MQCIPLLDTFRYIVHVGVSKNRGGPPKSSILMGFSLIFTIHFGVSLFLETPMYILSTHIVSLLQFDNPGAVPWKELRSENFGPTGNQCRECWRAYGCLDGQKNKPKTKHHWQLIIINQATLQGFEIPFSWLQNEKCFTTTQPLFWASAIRDT